MALGDSSLTIVGPQTLEGENDAIGSTESVISHENVLDSSDSESRERSRGDVLVTFHEKRNQWSKDMEPEYNTNADRERETGWLVQSLVAFESPQLYKHNPRHSDEFVALRPVN